MSEDIVHFEDETFNRIKKSKRDLAKFIFTLLAGIVAVYLSGFIGRNSEKVSLGFKILFPTLLLIGIGGYLVLKNAVVSITFSFPEKNVTVTYYRLFKEKRKTFKFNEFRYDIRELKTNLYHSNRMQILSIMTIDNMRFDLATKPSKDSMNYDLILQTIRRIKKY